MQGKNDYLNVIELILTYKGKRTYAIAQKKKSEWNKKTLWNYMVTKRLKRTNVLLVL